MLSSAEIRARFLAFFESQGHVAVPSSPLVPANDPTLLFANAGMVQFKDVFTGLEARPYRRATTAQKCMRVSGKHNDLDAVGPSPRHHTWCWATPRAISTRAMLPKHAASQIDPQRLAATGNTNDEAYALWQEVAGPPPGVSPPGQEDNFWRWGTGPCGPCSEIHDRGPEACTCGRPDRSPPGCDRCRVVEPNYAHGRTAMAR